MSSDYLLSTPACQNWLLICKTDNKWHMCKSIYMEVSGRQSRGSVLFLKTRKKLINGFSQNYLHYIYCDQESR